MKKKDVVLLEKTREILEKQLELLSEQSQNCRDNSCELAAISHAMAKVAESIVFSTFKQERF